MERLTSSFTRLDKLNGAHQALPIIPATPSGCQRIKGDLQAVVRGMQTAVRRLRAGERPRASLEKSPPPPFKVAASFQEKSVGFAAAKCYKCYHNLLP
ncbi:hypothetical protein ABG768_027607 [Culter alburnus]|uniref:Uncharacterized protein n=1 Tax=Culter alburnus TaxID=194366 RepID=A0AAW2AA75_CULAL